MSATAWTALLVVIGAYVALATWLLRRGGRLQRVQELGFVCPRLLEAVRCRITQDVRIGRWLAVESCSAFPDAQPLTCDRECVRLLNAGRRLPPAPA